jgi:DNA-binding response OmpR family regulator
MLPRIDGFEVCRRLRGRSDALRHVADHHAVGVGG